MHPHFIRQALITLAVSLAAGSALADSDESLRTTTTHPAYRNECGSCHVAFPPGLLPASSWRAVMGGLERHFGSDASLDAQTAADITRYLSTNAARHETADFRLFLS